jgi:hypothetical protein
VTHYRLQEVNITIDITLSGLPGCSLRGLYCTEKGKFFGGNTSMVINELTININDIYDLAILELRAL